MWLHRLKLWNTMPSLERMRSIWRRSAGTVWPWLSAFSLISSPLTRMMPLVGFSRQLMQRSSVDLPEPEPPMMATTSPSRADSDTPFSTCSWPNFLCRFSIWIASAAPSRSASAMAAALVGPASDRVRCLVASRSALVITLSHSNPTARRMDRPARVRQPRLCATCRPKAANG